MTRTRRQLIKTLGPIFLVSIALVGLWGLGRWQQSGDLKRVTGSTMGTSYRVTYHHSPRGPSARHRTTPANHQRGPVELATRQLGASLQSAIDPRADADAGGGQARHANQFRPGPADGRGIRPHARSTYQPVGLRAAPAKSRPSANAIKQALQTAGYRKLTLKTDPRVSPKLIRVWRAMPPGLPRGLP